MLKDSYIAFPNLKFISLRHDFANVRRIVKIGFPKPAFILFGAASRFKLVSFSAILILLQIVFGSSYLLF